MSVPNTSPPFHDGCYCYRQEDLAAARSQGLPIRCGGGLPCMCLGPSPCPIFDDETAPLAASELDPAWDALLDPLLSVSTAVSQKRPRPSPAPSCQCPCAAMHLAAAAVAAKQRKCCGGNCSCPPGECRCPQTAVPTAYRCCPDPADLVADNVAAALSIADNYRHTPAPAACCGDPPRPQLQSAPLHARLPPSLNTHPHRPAAACCGPTSAPPDQAFQPPLAQRQPQPPPPLAQQSASCCAATVMPPLPPLTQPIPPYLVATSAAQTVQELQAAMQAPPPSHLQLQPQLEGQSQFSVPRSSGCGQAIGTMQLLPPADNPPSALLAQLYTNATLSPPKHSNGVHHPDIPIQVRTEDHSRGPVLAERVLAERVLAERVLAERSVQAMAEVSSSTSAGRGRGRRSGGAGVKRVGRGRGRSRGRAASFPDSRGSSTMSGISSSPLVVPTSSEGRSRPFACDKCTSTFFFKQNRDRHINEVHLGHRPHKCEFPGCESAFKNRSGLKQHARTVHEKARPFKCERCDSAFGQRNHLTQHVLVVHEKVKMYKCDLCSMTFSNVGNRTQHIRRRHSEEADQSNKSPTAVQKAENVPAPET